jgi:hypothetical protein
LSDFDTNRYEELNTYSGGVARLFSEHFHADLQSAASMTQNRLVPRPRSVHTGVAGKGMNVKQAS